VGLRPPIRATRFRAKDEYIPSARQTQGTANPVVAQFPDCVIRSESEVTWYSVFCSIAQPAKVSGAFISDKLAFPWIINRMAQLEHFRLKVFRAVAEHLNFHDAAEHLFITQPAVTLQIKALENDLGVRLFDRTRGGITLTRQGSGWQLFRRDLRADSSGGRGPSRL
jgi:DNA-binding transcriptional ArsR family regulator